MVVYHYPSTQETEIRSPHVPGHTECSETLSEKKKKKTLNFIVYLPGLSVNSLVSFLFMDLFFFEAGSCPAQAASDSLLFTCDLLCLPLETGMQMCVLVHRRLGGH